MASLTTILSWFKTGLKPTENQFAQAWSSFWHKDDSIPQSAVTGLLTMLNSLSQSSPQPDTVVFNDSSGIYTIPSGKMLTLLVIESATNQALSIGTAAGLTDLLESEQILAGRSYAVHLDVIAERTASRAIYLRFDGPLTISFHKQNFYKQ